MADKNKYYAPGAPLPGAPLLSFLVIALVLGCLGPAQAICDVVPKDVQIYLNENPRWKIVSEKDLPLDDQELWRRYHNNACPGFVAADLDGTGQLYYAVALMRSENGQLIEKLVLVTKSADQLIEYEVSGRTSVSSPWVVWRVESGEVFDYNIGKQIKVPHESIIYEKMETTAFQYYMLNGQLHSALTSE